MSGTCLGAGSRPTLADGRGLGGRACGDGFLEDTLLPILKNVRDAHVYCIRQKRKRLTL